MCKNAAGPALRLAPLSARDARAAAELFRETVHAVNARDYTFASITARPFFERRGYVVLRENVVARAGVRLTNFLMEKDLGSGW